MAIIYSILKDIWGWVKIAWGGKSKRWEKTKAKLEYIPNVYYDKKTTHCYCARCSDEAENPITIPYFAGTNSYYCKTCGAIIKEHELKQNLNSK